MAFKLSFSENYLKNVQKLTEAERKQLRTKLLLLAENPMHPSLRSKKIQGSSKYYECSVNMDIRIIWFYSGNTIIAIVDIGHHDILKKF